MKVGIIGTGRVGGTLGKRWAKQGHAILFGSRDPDSDKVKTLLAEIGGAQADGVRNAAAFGEAILIAVPGTEVLNVIKGCGDLRDKIIVDAANWFDERPQGVTTSLAEALAQAAPGARVVKAFNTTGIGNMTNPGYGTQNASILICGDDADAKAVVGDLASSIGFDVVDAGPLSAAALLEHLAQLWVHLAHRQGLGPNVAWKLLRR